MLLAVFYKILEKPRKTQQLLENQVHGQLVSWFELKTAI